MSKSEKKLQAKQRNREHAHATRMRKKVFQKVHKIVERYKFDSSHSNLNLILPIPVSIEYHHQQVQSSISRPLNKMSVDKTFYSHYSRNDILLQCFSTPLTLVLVSDIICICF